MKFIFFFLLLLLITEESFGFPQMIRHGYNRCTSCHVSPRGGGVLNDYGRVLSREVLSAWGYEGEEQWHFGAIKPNYEKESRVFVGGDFRALQSYYNDKSVTQGRFIRMQEEIEVAGQWGDTKVAVRGGGDTTLESRPWYFNSYWVYQRMLSSWTARLGRFTPRFGVNSPEHIFSTKGNLGFGYQSERDTFELAYEQETWEVIASQSFGKNKAGEEMSATFLQANWLPSRKVQMGFNLQKEYKNDESQSFGFHSLLGFSERFYGMSEVIWSDRLIGGVREGGLYEFSKIGYELAQGLHVIFIQDFNKKNFSRNGQSVTTIGGGFTIFPRPHFEFQAIWSQRKIEARGQEWADFAWVMMHFYL
ncbi:MAG: hypothetical protein KDD33_08800 [Bdellovibrionales bacterium]|nr:hypothetical protein [Bdellovibrionales bacterium]